MKNVSDCVILLKGLSNGKHLFTFELGDSFFKRFEGAEIELGKLFATVVMDKQTTLMQLFVNINGSVNVACDRCLDDISLPINTEGKLILRFAATQSGELAEGENDEVMTLSTTDSEVDLSQYFFDCINLALPLQRLHPEGECNPEMIAKLQTLIINKE